jgi:hypothetical protein
VYDVNIGRNLRVALAGTAATLAFAPAAQACFVRQPQPQPQPADACKNVTTANDLLARYGSALSAQQRQAVADAINSYASANCGVSGGGSTGGATT